MQKIFLSFIVFFCSWPAWAEQETKTIEAQVAIYQAWEGNLRYISRILVTPDYLRLDEGPKVADFTLFDRQSGVVYNVVAEDQAILVMQTPEPVPQKDCADLQLRKALSEEVDAPKIAGQTPVKVDLFAGSILCSRVVAIPKVLEDSVAAQIAFSKAMAKIQHQLTKNVPLASDDLCAQAELVYFPHRHLDFGLPILQDSNHKGRQLVDFDPNFKADAALFRLPKHYRRQSLLAD